MKGKGSDSFRSRSAFSIEELEARLLLSGTPTVTPAPVQPVKYDGSATTIQVAAGLSVASAQQLTSASVAISVGYHAGEDELVIAGQKGTSGVLSDGVAWAFDSSTGSLDLTGSASAASYQQDCAYLFVSVVVDRLAHQRLFHAPARGDRG